MKKQLLSLALALALCLSLAVPALAGSAGTGKPEEEAKTYFSLTRNGENELDDKFLTEQEISFYIDDSHQYTERCRVISEKDSWTVKHTGSEECTIWVGVDTYLLENGKYSLAYHDSWRENDGKGLFVDTAISDDDYPGVYLKPGQSLSFSSKDFILRSENPNNPNDQGNGKVAYRLYVHMNFSDDDTWAEYSVSLMLDEDAVAEIENGNTSNEPTTPEEPNQKEAAKVANASFVLRNNKPVGASWNVSSGENVEAPEKFTIAVKKVSNNVTMADICVYEITLENKSSGNLVIDTIDGTLTYSHHFGGDNQGKLWDADSLNSGEYYVSVQPDSNYNGCAISPYWTKEATPSTGGDDTPVNPDPPVIPDIPFVPSNPSTGNSGGSNNTTTKPSTSTDTVTNLDGSTTTTKTDKTTGTVTETTKETDGSQTVVETKTDGTVTTTATDPAGNKTLTVENPNGSTVTTIENRDGGASTTTVSASGQVTAVVTAPAAAVAAAQTGGQAVALPMPEVPLTANTAAAPVVTVTTGSSQPIKVEIPVERTTPGTVAVIVNADGTEEVVKTSLATGGGVTLNVPDGATVKIVDNSKSFADTVSHWAGDAITFATAHELFNGTGAGSFTPNGTMTRGMLVTVLARYDGVDTAAGATWYEKGVEWAAANNISGGADLDAPVSREQLATMLYRYAVSSGLDTTASGTLTGFADAGSVSGYAADAMAWAVGTRLIGGTDKGELNPNGSATRAEVAAILMRFCENVMK